MRSALLNPGRYLKAQEFGEKYPLEPTFEIEDAAMEKLEEAGRSARDKGAIRLKGIPVLWVVNVINVKCLEAMWGDETDLWKGKRVTLYEDREVESFGEIVSGIRVRGSPDIARDITLKLKLKKGGTKHLTLKKTSVQTSAARQAPADAATEVAFAKHPLYRRKLVELTDDQLRELVTYGGEAAKLEGLTREQLGAIEKGVAAFNATLASRAPKEPGAEG